MFVYLGGELKTEQVTEQKDAKIILRLTNHLLSSCCTVLPQLLLHSTWIVK